MPTIIACFKWVVDEAYLRFRSTGEPDFASVDYKISDYDRNAIEEAVRLKETFGGKALGITVGPPEAVKGVKDALSRGLDEAYFLSDPGFRDLEASQTSVLLARVIASKIQAYDMILCGEGSSDLYAQQVGPRMAELLDIPCISFAKGLVIQDGWLTAERKVEEGFERLSLPLPALVTVLPDINIPRIPGVKDTLMASRKPSYVIPKQELLPFPEPRLRTVGLAALPTERICEKFAADTGGIERFVALLRKRGIIP